MKIRFAFTQMLLAGLFILSSGVCAQADSIAGLYTTGEGSAPGEADLHYSLVSAPEGVSLDTFIPSVTPSSWYVPANASWLGLADDANAGLPEGDYTFRLTFNLVNSFNSPLDPTTASINGLFACDDLCTVLLNGNIVGFAPNNPADTGFGALSTLDITSGFVNGANTLDFMVHNLGPETNPTGLLVYSFDSFAQPLIPVSVPEPGTLTFLMGGLAALGVVYYYRFRRPAKAVIPIKLNPATAARFKRNPFANRKP